MRFSTSSKVAAPGALAVAALLVGGAPAQAELRVVVSSKPIHALVAAVMEGTGTPSVLVAGASSPHSYAMKPSDAQAANKANVFFRVAPTLEPFTVKLAAALPKSVKVVTLIDAPGLQLLDRRETGPFEAHGHGHDHDHGAKKGQKEDERDPHIWLDPQNAAAMVDHIATVLSAAEPANAATYKRNADAAKVRIAALTSEIADLVKSYSGKPFVVLHDAYQYFEQRFGLTAVGAIAVNPETPPSGKRLAAIRQKIRDAKAACVFAEPGMQPKVIAAVTEKTEARTGELDPEATRLQPGTSAYFELMRGLAKGFKACFDPN